ncbi:MAG: DUF1080 domain-containing protein [Halobacteriales archaeon]
MAGEWRPLFDGESLAGWSATGPADRWTVADGELVCRGESASMPTLTTYLFAHERFGDFDFELEYNHEPDANSGIYFRWSELSERGTGMEVQILDPERDVEPSHACGALYDMVAPASMAARPAGEWNRLRLTCEGPEIAVTLNGERVVEADIDEWTTPGENPDGTGNKFDFAMADLPREGRLALQNHGGRVRFRDLRVRER